jgi:hypothetical protein
MGAAALPAALGLGGLFLQNQANKDASKTANRATGNQKELIKRQTELFDKIAGIVSGADAAGQFDPQKQLDQLQSDTQYYANRDIGNTAGAARTLGYRPGDSAPLKSIRSIDSAYKLQYGQQANQIRQNAFNEKLSAYRAIDPSALNPGIQTYGQQAQQAQSQVGGLGQLAGFVQPFLQQKQSAKPAVNLGNLGLLGQFYH